MTTPQEAKFDMIRRLHVADYMTLSNALCGVLSIFASIQQRYFMAHILIFIGYEFDKFDGIVARWMNQCSDWGKQLDSFSDMVSFVVAPAIMLYTIGFQTPADQIALIFWVLCGLTRLVRFNVTAHLVPKGAHGKAAYHEGLPSPYAALIVSTILAVSAWMNWHTEFLSPSVAFHATWAEVHLAMIPVTIIGALMASKRLKLTIDGSFGIPAVSVVIFASCWSFAPLRL